MAIDLDFVKRGKYSLHIRKFFLFPEFWIDGKKDIKVNPSKWKSVEFERTNLSKVSTQKGIYAFVLKPKYPSLFQTSYLFYIGKTTRPLQVRFLEYFSERDGKGKYRYLVREFLRLYKGHLFFYFLELNTKKEVDTYEELLLNTFVPFVNTDIPEAKIDPDIKYIYKSS